MDNIPTRPKFLNPISTPLVISMLGIACTTIVILLYHLVVVKYCVRRNPQTTHTPPQSAAHGDSTTTTGVDEKLLETIPIVTYSSQNHALFLRVGQDECAICLGNLEEREKVRLLPNCRHAFHVPCIDQWLTGHTNCPICRSAIVAPIDHLVQEIDRTVGDQCPIRGQANDRTGGERSLLRHCASLVLPTERRPCLKRSLSMDQYHFVIGIRRESERGSSLPSTSSSSTIPPASSSASIDVSRRLDLVSSKLLASFSRLRMGRNAASNGNLLPY